MPLSEIQSRCPRCEAQFSSDTACPECGLAFVRRGGVLDVLASTERETRAAEVEAFYTKSPFPGYGPSEDRASLLDRSRQSAFLNALDAAIPSDGRVLDAGCGTAQLAAFLSIAGPRRKVFGVDGCRASLAHADEFRTRVKLDNLQLVRGDLFELPVPEDRFPIVISRGVVHHTPDPERATLEVAKRVEPGGILILGFYETWGRRFHCIRRGIGKLRGGEPFYALDAVLRRKDLDDEKKRIWIDDQYKHPLEHILPLPWVCKLLERNGFRWVRSVPPASGRTGFFEETKRPKGMSMVGLRSGWALSGIKDPDAGLVCVVYRRPT